MATAFQCDKCKELHPGEPRILDLDDIGMPELCKPCWISVAVFVLGPTLGAYTDAELKVAEKES